MTHRTLIPAAALCVLLTGVLLVLTRPTGSVANASGPRVVHGPEGSFAVGSRWSRTTDEAVLYYADPAGRPVVGLAGAVVADAGFCAGLPTSQRGFAGFADVAPGGAAAPLATLTREVAASWASGISGRDPPAPSAHDLAVRELSLSDGTAAFRVSTRLRSPETQDPCVARRVVLDVVGFRVEGGAATFVLVRDVDPSGVSDHEAEEMVQSLRRRT